MFDLGWLCAVPFALAAYLGLSCLIGSFIHARADRDS